MARVVVPVQQLALNSGTVSAGTAIDTTNGHVIRSGGYMARTVIRVDNTGTKAGSVVLKGGVNPPALRSALGDTAIAVGASSEVYIALESARYAQANGDVNIDMVDLGGSIYAYELPIGR